MARRKNKNFTLPVTIVVPFVLSLICSGLFIMILRTFFSRYPYFNVSKVSVRGIEEGGLFEFKRSLLGKNIFSYGFTNLKKQVEEAGGGIVCVSIERRLPGELLFTLRKRVTVAQIKFFRFHPVDESGMLMPGASDIAYEGLPVIFGLESKTQKGNLEKYYSVSEARNALTLIQQKNNSPLLRNYVITKINLRKQKMSSFFIIENSHEPLPPLVNNSFSRQEVEVKFDPQKPTETINVLGLLLEKRKNMPEVSLSRQDSLCNIEYIDLTNTNSPIVLEKKEIKRSM